MLIRLESEVAVKVVEQTLGRIDRPSGVTIVFVVRDLPEILDKRNKGLVFAHRLPDIGTVDGVGLVLFPEIVRAFEVEAIDAGVAKNDIVTIFVGKDIPTGQELATMGASIDIEAGLPDLPHDLSIKRIDDR